MPDSQQDFGPIVITPREIYDAVIRLTDRVNELIQQGQRMEERLSTVNDDLLDHEARLRVLERARWPLPAVAIIVSVAAIILPFLLR